MRWPARLAVGYLALLIATWVGVSRWSAIAPPAATDGPLARSTIADEGPRVLDEQGAAAVLATLRARLSGAAPASATPRLRWRGQAALWCNGRSLGSTPVSSDGQQLEAAGLAVMATALDGVVLAECRLRLDVERGRGPIITSIEPLFALSLIPGLDALGLDYAGREVVLSTDELLRADLLAGHRPIPGVDVDLGLDTRGALRMLALRAGADSSTWRRTPHHLFRVRTESWVEPAEVAARARIAVPLLRGHSPAPPLSATSLTEAGRAGAAWLDRHLKPEGRFVYIYDPLVDQALPDADDYSLPRHAGASWYLAQAGGALHEPRFLDGARRALRYLQDHPPAGCDRPAWACAGNPGERHVDLGSTAMALLAATEYRRASGDASFDPWARRLAAFVKMMQRDDGDFRHLYDLEGDRPDERARLLYYSGEASLALARLGVDAGTSVEERADLAARVDRALRWLTIDNYAYFAGGFFYGEDHWTCIAANDAWDLVGPGSTREVWGDFCEGFAAFLDRSRFVSGEGPVREQPDLVGAYGFTPLVPPHPTPVGSRSEALISSYHLAVRRGHTLAAARIAAAIRDGMRFLLAHQIRRDDTWLMPDPAAAEGGFTMSDVKPQIRIDFLQHAGSAMLRAALVPALSTEAGATAPPSNVP